MKIGKQFIRFGIVGVLNTAVQFAVFVVLYRYLHMPMLVASGVGYLAGIVNSYFINRVWTFEVTEKRQTAEFLRFVAVNIVSMGVNLGTLKILVELGGLMPEVAQVLAIGSSLVVNFLGNRFWTFRENNGTGQQDKAILSQEESRD